MDRLLETRVQRAWDQPGDGVDRDEGRMGTNARALLAFLFVLNLLAVGMGYVAIAKFQRFHVDLSQYPYFLYPWPCGPKGLLLFWHDHPIAIFAGAILLPSVALWVLFGRGRPIIGTMLLFLSFVPFGVAGFVMWFHAFMFLPHDLL